MQIAVGDENRSVAMTALAFLLAAVLVIISSAITIAVFKTLGASDLLSGSVAASYFTSIKLLHQRIERRLYVRRGISTARLNTPTHSPLRVIAYAALIVFGYYGSTALFGMALGAAAPWLVERGLSLTSVFVAIFAVGILTGLAVPTASYLVGEWVGRSLGKRRDALLVAVGAPFLALALYWGFGHLFIGTFKEAFETSQGAMTKTLQYGWAIITSLNLLTIITPMLVGAYRGATHKPFYDLAFFARRLPHPKNEEILDFVRTIEQEYATTSPP